MSDPLSTTEAFGILDQIKATGNPVVILSGGEPMMQDLPEAKSLVASMKGGCSAGIRVVNVTETGDLYPCQFAQIPEFRIGSIREQPFSKLWNDPENPVLKMFREKRSVSPESADPVHTWTSAGRMPGQGILAVRRILC